MPIFEYRCRKCGAEFERIVPRESVQVNCPKCGEPEAERLLSSFAVSGAMRRGGGCAPSGGG